MQSINGFLPGGSFGIPTYVVLDRELRLQAENVSHSQAISMADTLLAEPIPDVAWPLPEDGVIDTEEGEEGGDTESTAPEANPFAEASFAGEGCSMTATNGGGQSWLTLLLAIPLLARRRRD